jgi:hypothetical protein
VTTLHHLLLLEDNGREQVTVIGTQKDFLQLLHFAASNQSMNTVDTTGAQYNIIINSIPQAQKNRHHAKSYQQLDKNQPGSL